jgi:hypothetical protein
MSHLSLVRDVAPNVWITFWRILHGDAALSHCPKFECFVTQLHGGAGHHEQKKQNRRDDIHNIETVAKALSWEYRCLTPNVWSELC